VVAGGAFRYFLLVLAVSVAVLTAMGVDCFADEPDRRRDLDRIRAQIGSLETQLSRIDAERVGLEAELARTDMEVRLQEKQVAEARAERQLAEEAMRQSEERAAELALALEGARSDLRQRLESLYRRGERDLLRSFLSTNGGGGALDEMRMLRLLARRDAYWVGQYLGARDDLMQEREILVGRRLEVEKTTARESERLRRLTRTRTLQSRALEVIRARREGVEERASQLADKEEKLSLLLAILAGRETPPPEGIAIQSFEGALDWPIRGRIMQGFGARSEARYRTKIPHNGIEIATARHSEVRVIFPGVVVFSSPFEDFGLTVVVHHPDRVFSLYAGLETVLVAKGDVVSFSDALGEARDSVYFEIRVENRPQDPLTWLR
jgi:septal ring factor EnvC (AmiA/AmiB activator)